MKSRLREGHANEESLPQKIHACYEEPLEALQNFDKVEQVAERIYLPTARSRRRKAVAARHDPLKQLFDALHEEH